MVTCTLGKFCSKIKEGKGSKINYGAKVVSPNIPRNRKPLKSRWSELEGALSKRSHFVVVCYSGQLLPDLQKFLRSKKAIVLDTHLGATNRHRHSVCNLWSSRTKMDFGYRFEFELWLQEALSVC